MYAASWEISEVFALQGEYLSLIPTTYIWKKKIERIVFACNLSGSKDRFMKLAHWPFRESTQQIPGWEETRSLRERVM